MQMLPYCVANWKSDRKALPYDASTCRNLKRYGKHPFNIHFGKYLFNTYPPSHHFWSPTSLDRRRPATPTDSAPQEVAKPSSPQAKAGTETRSSPARLTARLASN
ncbi:hypothetical protein Cob_v004591 [Colletotrichum orbiculare MAFF 240422]|uniref:Uncharacterized protein n=1 Tax=Colletotrichum orbiculare (strain 104-T / ATCC 96160 / CBS 514.97 / LARS 414 / MAFF 240422) TaxID=1213857 RepID=A0A484FX08_COLOR|nr:hypothetical protein Cob_v004591 [Colletotrichum orbiculare MAFF 240422]